MLTRNMIARPQAVRVRMFEWFSVDSGASYSNDADGVIAVSGTTTYIGRPILQKKRSNVPPLVQVVTTGTLTGNISFWLTDDGEAAIRDNTARWTKVTAGAFVNVGAAITFTTGDGAISGVVSTVLALTANHMGATAMRWQYVNATNSGTIEITMTPGR
jgi:hypothetical protein